MAVGVRRESTKFFVSYIKSLAIFDTSRLLNETALVISAGMVVKIFLGR